MTISEAPPKATVVTIPPLTTMDRVALYAWAFWFVDQMTASHGYFTRSETMRSGTILTAALTQVFLDHEGDGRASPEEIAGALDEAVVLIGMRDAEVAWLLKNPNHRTPQMLMGMGMDEFFWGWQGAGLSLMMDYRAFSDVLIGRSQRPVHDLDKRSFAGWVGNTYVKNRFTGRVPAERVEDRFTDLDYARMEPYAGLIYHVNSLVVPGSTSQRSSIIHTGAMNWMVSTFLGMLVEPEIPIVVPDDLDEGVLAFSVLYEELYDVAMALEVVDLFDTEMLKIKRFLALQG